MNFIMGYKPEDYMKITINGIAYKVYFLVSAVETKEGCRGCFKSYRLNLRGIYFLVTRINDGEKFIPISDFVEIVEAVLLEEMSGIWCMQCMLELTYKLRRGITVKSMKVEEVMMVV